MWYDGYREMNYAFSDYNQKSKEERVEELEELAEILRPNDARI